MAAGQPVWTALEEGRSKLLLAAIPDGAHVPREVATRVSLFERRAFEDLLSRIELQAVNKAGKKMKKTKLGTIKADSAARKSRARKQVLEGAYRKAIGTLTSKVAELSPAENKRWATELHPSAADRGGSLSGNDMAVEEDANLAESQCQSNADHPLAGVRFAALKAPGPSGTRPEHLSELLGIHRRRVANRLLRSLGMLLDVISEGGLSEEGRWIARSRTIFIEKKTGADPRPIKIGEVLRAASAKRLLRRLSPRLRQTFISMHQ
jgi:hypothetical protein